MITVTYEVDTVWKKPWTISSILYLSNRWVGLLLPVIGLAPTDRQVSTFNVSKLLENINASPDVCVSETLPVIETDQGYIWFSVHLAQLSQAITATSVLIVACKTQTAYG